MEDNGNKVYVKLQRQPLESERREIREKRIRTFTLISLFIIVQIFKFVYIYTSIFQFFYLVPVVRI